MLVNFTQTLIDIRDNEIISTDRAEKFTKEIKEVPLTLLMVCGDSLCNTLPGEVLTFEEKLDLAKILENIYMNRDACEVSIEHLAIIKKRIAKFYGPLVLLAVNKILEK